MLSTKLFIVDNYNENENIFSFKICFVSIKYTCNKTFLMTELKL